MYHKIIKKVIEKLHRSFSTTPYEFLSESDIQSKLFRILSKNKILSKSERIITDSCWGTNKKLKFKNLKTTRLHTEFLTIREKFDLVIIEPSDLEVRRNSKGKIGFIRLKDNKSFQAIIEIKTSRTNRSTRSKSNFKSEILKDLKKIKNFKFKIAYCLIFDFNNYLSKEDIVGFKEMNNKVKVFIFNIKEHDFLSH